MLQSFIITTAKLFRTHTYLLNHGIILYYICQIWCVILDMRHFYIVGNSLYINQISCAQIEFQNVK